MDIVTKRTKSGALYVAATGPWVTSAAQTLLSLGIVPTDFASNQTTRDGPHDLSDLSRGPKSLYSTKGISHVHLEKHFVEASIERLPSVRRHTIGHCTVDLSLHISQEISRSP